MITIYTSEEIEKIAAAGKLTADTLSMLEKAVRPGISTLELDEVAEKSIRSRGGIPSCKGYEGFPGSICASVNDTVVHGIPSARKILKKGDIISLDLVVELNGYMGDSCITVPVGHTNKKNAQLLKVTEEGESLIKHMNVVFEATENQLLDCLTEEEKATFKEYLTVAYDNITI